VRKIPFRVFSSVGAVPQVAARLEPLLAAVREAISTRENAMTIARQLGVLVGEGLRNKDLTVLLGQKKSWVSKKLGLLSAPVKVQRLIEAGELTESDYHNDKHGAAPIRSRAGTLEYRRRPTLTISLETAKTLALILQILAEENGDTSLKVPATPTKKDLSRLLDVRAAGVYELIK
jgi:hypothetical protein